MDHSQTHIQFFISFETATIERLMQQKGSGWHVIFLQHTDSYKKKKTYPNN